MQLCLNALIAILSYKYRYAGMLKTIAILAINFFRLCELYNILHIIVCNVYGCILIFRIT